MRTGAFSLVLLFLGLSVVAAQTATPLDPVTRRGTGERQLTIAIESPEERLTALARRAFRLHGGFRTVSGEGADPDLRLDLRPSGDRAVLFAVESSAGGLRGTGRGDDLGEATARALDEVVEGVLGTPGFFAGTIAFVGEREGSRQIFVGDILFREARRLTGGPADSVSPDLSPTAQRLLYTTYARSGFPDIYEIDLATRRSRPFADYRGTNTGPAFNRQGNRVAMILSSSGNAELYVADANGQNPRRLTDNRTLESGPSWSPDGREIALASDRLGNPQIYRIPAEGGALQRVPTDISGYCAEPAWNPREPRLLAFTAATSGGFQVALHDLASGESRFLTQVSGDAIEPAWLNDGRHLLYTRRQGERTRLFLLDTHRRESVPVHSADFGNSSQADFVYPR